MRNSQRPQLRLRLVACAVAVGLVVGGFPVAASATASTTTVDAAGFAISKSQGVYCDRSVFSFVDVPWDAQFRSDINWMTCQGIARGTRVEGTGKYLFRPKESLTREAMAAFLFRLQERRDPKDGPAYRAPGVSPFADVLPRDKFYREIVWMHENGIATGTAQPSGKPLFEPKQTLSREAMAAFLFRHQKLQGERQADVDKTKGFVTPPSTRFVDITPDSKFYRQIAWMEAAGVSTGVKAEGGIQYQPKGYVSREAMAAFLHRLFR